MSTRARVGDLTERVKLLRKTRTPDGVGGFTVAWTAYAEVWAQVTPKSGRETEQAMRQEASAMYEVLIRARSDIHDDDTIEWRGRSLNIRFPRRMGSRAQYMVIEAEMGARV